MWYNLSCHSHAGARFCFSSNSRLSVSRSHDCDKHEKQQVGGSLIRGTMKRCTKCGIEKTDNNFDDYKKRGRVYLHSWCKECRKADHRKWSRESAEHIHEYNLKYYQDNADYMRQRSRDWGKNNPEKRYLANKRSYFQKVQENLERVKKWYAENRVKKQEYRRTRRIRMNGKVTAEEWLQLLDEAGHRCLRCGATDDLTLDHVVPVSKGGKNIKANGQVLCRRCNAVKGTKTVDYRRQNSPKFEEQA